jgi:predicted enzyme related to lactoylglutathione lyase
VPCWVDVLVPDTAAATAFYGGVFGWEFDGPGPMPDGGGYYVGRLDGADVAGVGSAPRAGADGPPAAWNTYISVASVKETVDRAIGAGATVLVSPFDAAPAGRGAVLAGPDGAAICLWEPLQRPGAQRVNEPSAWAMSLLQTSAPEEATRFYGELFGWEPWSIEGDSSGVVLYRLPGYVGGEPQQPVPRDVVAAMAPLPAQAGIPAHWSVDFWIADAAGAAQAAPGLGGSVIAPPHDAPPFKRAVLSDPFGASFSVSQLQPYG